MATEISPQIAADIQAMMANVEAAYRSTNAARTALSTLLNVGQATCRDVQLYNLQVKAVYAYQASVAGIAKAAGTTGVPNVPAPFYVAWRGISGEQAANIDCTNAQMRGAAPAGQGEYKLSTQQVEWRQEVLPSTAATVNQVVTAASRAAVQAGSGQLGVAPLVFAAIVIVSIVVIVAAVVLLKIVEAFTDIPGKRETTRQISIQADEHRRTLEQRAACYSDCTSRGASPLDCQKGCDRMTPAFVAQYPGGGLGIFGTILGVAVLGGVIYLGWRNRDSLRNYVGAGRKQLVGGASDGDIDYDNAIDVEAA